MTTTFKQVSDNAAGLLSAAIDADDLTLGVDNPAGATFPASGPFWVTLFTSDPGTGCEVVLVASRSGNMFTLSARGQEGTSAQSWSAGTNVRLLLMAQHLEDLHTAVNAIEAGINFGQTTEFLSVFEPTERAKIKINGVEYWIALDPVL